MTVLIIALLASLVTCGPCLADYQWSWVNPLPVGIDFKDVWGPDPGNVFAVGENGFIYHWDGAEWIDQTPSSGLSQTKSLYTVWGFASDQMFAAGRQFCEWNGVEWQEKADLEGVIVNDLWGTSPDNLYATATTPAREAIIMSWDGSKWKTVVSEHGHSERMNAIWGSGPDDIYAAYNEDYSATIFHWNGTAWAPTPDIGTENIRDIWGTGSQDVYIADNYRLLHWDGNAWTVVLESEDSSFCDIWGFSDTLIFTRRSDGMILQFDGSEWSEWQSINADGLDRVWGASLQSVFAVGKSGVVTVWDGVEWHRYNRNLFWKNIQDSAGFSSNGNIYGVTDQGTVIRFDGMEWSEIDIGESHDVESIWVDPDGIIYLCGPNGWIRQGSKSGWETMTTGTDAHFYSIWGSSSSSVFVAGKGGTILHYDGSQWQQMFAGLSDSDFRCIWGLSDSELFAVGEEGIIARYNGTQWQYDISITTETLVDIWGTASDDLYAVSGDTCMIIHWDGSAWTELFPDGYSGIHTILGFGSDDIYFGESQILHHWNGTDWNSYPVGLPVELNSIFGWDGQNIYGFGNAGEIIRWTDVPDTLGVQIEIPTNNVHPGEDFYITGRLNNPGLAQLDVPVFFILNIWDQFWFWDNWAYYYPPDNMDIDFNLLNVPKGTMDIPVIPAFTWPDTGTDHLDGIKIYGAMLNSEMDEIQGDMEMIEFGFSGN